MAMVINDKGSDGGVLKTDAQIAAELARQRKITELKNKISKLDKSIKELEKKKEEFNEMIGGISTALGYLEQAKGEAQGIRNSLAGSYTGNNARTYVSQVENCEGDITLNVNKLNLVSSVASEKVAEIDKKIVDKKVERAKYKIQLSEI